jgi:hypothetical protein
MRCENADCAIAARTLQAHFGDRTDRFADDEAVQ